LSFSPRNGFRHGGNKTPRGHKTPKAESLDLGAEANKEDANAPIGSIGQTTQTCKPAVSQGWLAGFPASQSAGLDKRPEGNHYSSVPLAPASRAETSRTGGVCYRQIASDRGSGRY
jgi:hypothetical protein